MNGPNETGITEYAGWAAGLGAVWIGLKRFFPKADPRLLLVWANKPVMAPVIERLDRFEGRLERVQRVMDRLPGADAAHAAIQDEDEARKRWEPLT